MKTMISFLHESPRAQTATHASHQSVQVSAQNLEVHRKLEHSLEHWNTFNAECVHQLIENMVLEQKGAQTKPETKRNEAYMTALRNQSHSALYGTKESDHDLRCGN